MRIVVAGALANKPAYGGEAWVRLAWSEGFRRQGAQVLFVEQLAVPPEPEAQGDPRVRFFEEVTRRRGLDGRAALLGGAGEPLAGLPPEEVADFAAGADLLVNLSGHLSWQPVLEGVRRRAYVDLDPGFTQLWHLSGEGALGLERHDVHFTVGENVGTAACDIPTAGIRWLPTRQPVVLDDWPYGEPPDRPRFTTVASWRGAFGPVEHGGRRYGLKAHQFRKVVALPRGLPFPAEIALDIHPADTSDRELLERAGWRLVDPRRVAGTPEAFRDYVRGSAAELTVAQEIYVATGSGWFSDRSARYLASGRPVVVQDTGFGRTLPVGEGLFAFRTAAEARAAARELARDLPRHARAARRIAEEHFDAHGVLDAFLERALEGGGARPRRGRALAAPAAVEAGGGSVDAAHPPAGDAAAPAVSSSVAGIELSAPRPISHPATRLLGRRGVLLVSGMAAGVPGQGGATWAVLQYVLGFLRFGLDVHFVEEMDASTLRPGGADFERSLNARYFRRLVRRFGLEGRATLLLSGTERTLGRSYPELVELCERAPVVLNLSGKLVDPELLGRPPQRVYVDLDPAFTQLWQDCEGVDMRLAEHTDFVTVGLRLGAPDCPLPTCGVRWTVTLPPVVLDEWPLAGPPRWDAWTTVANWRGYGSIHRNGLHYGQKAHAFRELLELPRRTRDRFRLALGIHPSEREDLDALRRNAWDLVDPEDVAGDPDRYHRFVQGSAAEVGVAKTGYVVSRSGWFSDRSACYLASGRPVLAQDTGFGDHLPTGLGLVPFRSLEEAADGVARVRADYARHARAARCIAEQHLDSERVLPRLLAELAA